MRQRKKNCFPELRNTRHYKRWWKNSVLNTLNYAILFAQAGARSLGLHELQSFAEKLAQHIRKEERQLFEQMQQLMPPQELAVLGAALEEALKDATQACAIPKRP